MIIPKLSAQIEHDIVSSIIDAVGRSVILTYVSSRDVCSVCGGTNPFCTTCHGNPTVDVVKTKTVTANIKWRGSDQKLYRPEGQAVEGDCLINFMTDTVDDLDELDELLKQIITVKVDNRICVLDKWYFRGSPVNRVYLVLSQDSTIGGQRIG